MNVPRCLARHRRPPLRPEASGGAFGGFRALWVIALFDLPVDTKAARQAYREFRDLLLDDGFAMLQYSVYGRPCASSENAEVHHARITAFLPDDGEVRVLTLTDKQFERMAIYRGKLRGPTERAPEQLTFL